MDATMSNSLAYKNMFQAKEYRDFSVADDDVTLRRPEEGKKVELAVNGQRYEVGRMASAFPLSSSLEAVVFYDTDGEEIGLLKQVGQLDSDSQSILTVELEKSYFMPCINAVLSREEKLGVETWKVVTNKGERSFEVRDPRNSVRAIGRGRVIIHDVDSNRYDIRDWQKLDRKSVSLMA